MLFHLISTIYFQENYTNGVFNNKWDPELSNDICNIHTCLSSHPDFPIFCLSPLLPQKVTFSRAKLNRSIERLPFFAYFTFRISDFSKSTFSYSLLDENFAKEVSVNISYDNKLSATLLLSSSSEPYTFEFMHDIDLTHSVALAVQEDKNVIFYTDGMPVFKTNISKSQIPISYIQKDFLVQKANSIEVSNFYISDNITDRWNLLINTVLRFREFELNTILDFLVDEEERKIFPGIKPIGKSSKGKLPTEHESDPRKFKFPFTVNVQGRSLNAEPSEQMPILKKGKEAPIQREFQKGEYAEL